MHVTKRGRAKQRKRKASLIFEPLWYIIMISLPRFRLLALLCIVILHQSRAFKPSLSFQTANLQRVAKAKVVAPNRRMSLQAYKKRVPVEKKKEEDSTDPLKLFLTYATPWRNPNSIFVYLFLIVYILGSISEAKQTLP